MDLSSQHKNNTHNTAQTCLTHIVQCSDGWAELLEEEWIEILCAPKINDLNHIHEGDDDVFWFDIQMQDSPAVQVVQTLKDLYNICHHVVFGVSESKKGDTNGSHQ